MQRVGIAAPAMMTFVLASAAAADLRPARLQCANRVNPLGVEDTKPPLSWTLVSQDKAQKQTAYQVLVASSPARLQANEGDLWDSGKVESDRQLFIRYAGRDLGARQFCHWKVKVWDGNGRASEWSKPARWSMGLLAPKTPTRDGCMEAWGGAGWISVEKEHPVATSGKWITIERDGDKPSNPVFIKVIELPPNTITIDYAVATRSAHRWGPRIWINGRDPNNRKQCRGLHGGRNIIGIFYGKHKEPADKQGVWFSMVFLLNTGELLTISSDETWKGYRQDLSVKNASAPPEKSWKPAKVLSDAAEYPWGGKHHAGGIKEWLKYRTYPAMLLRKPFKAEGAVKRATLYVTGLGLYEMHINGKRVGDAHLTPECTRYEKRVQYQVLDVTSYLQKGDNVVGGMLSDGWHGNYFSGLEPVPHRKYKGRRGLRVLLELEMADGSKKTVITDESWKGTDKGPIRAADLYHGEVYDARMEMAGWSTKAFDDKDWKQAQNVEFRDARFVAQRQQPMRVTRELKPVAVTKPKPGVYVFDMGQNMVGWVRMKFRAPKGRLITFQHAERKRTDERDGIAGHEYGPIVTTLYTANLRRAWQRNSYVAKGVGKEVYEPRFSYQGFRYIEVEGLVEKPSKDDLVGCVLHSDAPVVGKVETSNELMNRFMSNAFWSQIGNMHSIMTDCPQRTERMGWAGDIQVFSQMSIYNMDMAAFYHKYMADMRDGQHGDGLFPPFIPAERKHRGKPGWADAGVIVPYRCWVNYADRPLLEEHYESARRFVDFVHKRNPNLLWVNDGKGFGDWLNGDKLVLAGWPRKGAEVDKYILATAFFAYSSECLSKIAAALGKEEGAKEYAELSRNIKAAFNKAYVREDGTIQGDTQAAYALALRFNILPDALRPKAMEQLLAGIKRYNGHMSTGLQTTHRLLLELSRNGKHEEACRIVNLRKIPSLGYSIDNGATTMWERWDGYVKGRGYQSSGMNSFNHFWLGAVGEWVWRYIVGLNPDPEQPGYGHFVVRPMPCPEQGFTWAKATYDSVRGPIVVDWKIVGNRFLMEVTVPVNTTATVHLPGAKEAREIGSGTHHFETKYTAFVKDFEYKLDKPKPVVKKPSPPRPPFAAGAAKADKLYRTALGAERMGQRSTAKMFFEKIVKEYPGTPAATKAAKRLKKY
jgi:alpha-L-rhamnosidase